MPADTLCGDGVIGDPCWVDPEQPWLTPSCGGDLICVDYSVVDGVVQERGTCTKNCDANDCCPTGWACAAVTPGFAQCRPGSEDSEGFECSQPRNPEPEDDPEESDSGDSGCTAAHQGSPFGTVPILFFLLCIGFFRRPR